MWVLVLNFLLEVNPQSMHCQENPIFSIRLEILSSKSKSLHLKLRKIILFPAMLRITMIVQGFTVLKDHRTLRALDTRRLEMLTLDMKPDVGLNPGAVAAARTNSTQPRILINHLFYLNINVWRKRHTSLFSPFMIARIVVYQGFTIRENLGTYWTLKTRS